jgi:hypothetical protein
MTNTYWGDSTDGDDITELFADSPHEITIGSVTAKCLFSEPDAEKMKVKGGGGQVVRMASAIVRTNDFISGELVKDMPVAIGDRVFSIISWGRIQDGAVTRIQLKLETPDSDGADFIVDGNV